MKKIYIYKLTNTQNDKVYIGQTNNINARFYAQQYKGKKIKDAIQKIGWDNFHVNLIDEAVDQDTANDLEYKYIVQYDAVNSGYNSNYKTRENRFTKRSAQRNLRASLTMKTMKWYYNPITEESIRIADGKPVPNGFVPGRSLKKVRGHNLWLRVKPETAIADIA